MIRRSSGSSIDFQLDQFILPITEQEEEAMKEHTRKVKPTYFVKSPGFSKIQPTNSSPEKEFIEEENNSNPYETESLCFKIFLLLRFF